MQIILKFVELYVYCMGLSSVGSFTIFDSERSVKDAECLALSTLYFSVLITIVIRVFKS